MTPWGTQLPSRARASPVLKIREHEVPVTKTKSSSQAKRGHRATCVRGGGPPDSGPRTQAQGCQTGPRAGVVHASPRTEGLVSAGREGNHFQQAVWLTLYGLHR